jgi:asparaginyl-tRNA synthetase
MTTIDQLSSLINQTVTLHGWVYRLRQSKGLLFIELRDGSGICQSVIAESDVSPQQWEEAAKLKQESSVSFTGLCVADDRSEGGVELQVQSLEVLQVADGYPITPKEHGTEFLMDHRHLWLRSKRQWAIMRIRHTIIYAIHSYFHKEGFIHMDAPIFTGNPAEGTTTLFETEYFDEQAYLTQSGQLYGEAMAMAHGKIYTFGPTFRAEKSKTRRHLTEFWMIEPEMAFYDIELTMSLAEGLLQAVVKEVLATREHELAILGRSLETLHASAASPFTRLSYTEAVETLKSQEMAHQLDAMLDSRHDEKAQLRSEEDQLKQESGSAKKWRKVQIEQRRKEILERMAQVEEDIRNIPVWKESAATFEWGNDFGGSDETLLTMNQDRPTIVHRYPAAVKAFYMKRDPHDDALALALDVLAPEGYGEIVGGSQREESYDVLVDRIHAHDLDEEAFQWYLDLRRYGTVPHAGFGLGLERTVSWICGLSHLREAIPFPRLMGRLTP